MTDLITQIAWAVLALIHFPPALAVIRPGLVRTLYGVDYAGETGLLLVHRAWLFAAIFALCILAVFSPASRLAAILACTISMLGFLLLYARAGRPDGALRKIAIADLAGLPALAWVVFMQVSI